MNEAVLRREIGAALRKLWYRTHTSIDMTVCNACGNQRFPKGGEPDMFFWDWQGPFGCIEMKMFPNPTHDGWARTSFDLAKISPEQRAWMIYAKETGASHLYIGLGTRHGRAGAQKEPRLAWVIPWAYWLAVEEMLLPIQRSLPLTIRPGLRKQVRQQSLVADEVFAQYELKWEMGGWQFPTTHPIYHDRPLRYSLAPCDLVAARTRWAEIREGQRTLWK